MRRSSTLRTAAADVTVHLTTSFRWRHRILAGIVGSDRTRLQGTVELGIVAFAECRKGTRGMEFARVQGARFTTEWFNAGYVGVLVMRARTGEVFSCVSGGHRADPAVVRQLILPRLSGQCTLLGRLPRSNPMISVLRQAGHTCRLLQPFEANSGDVGSKLHNVQQYTRRLRGWIDRFRGVGSRYLHHYLTWHRLVDPELEQSWVYAAIIRLADVTAGD